MTVWAPRALAEVERQIETWPHRAADVSRPIEYWIGQLRQLEREAHRLRGGGLAKRGNRRMPSLKQIAEFHNLDNQPECYRCMWWPPAETWNEASEWLERAHIIDRAINGIDGPQNLLPLCGRCHRRQPMFDVSQEIQAMEWFNLYREAKLARPAVQQYGRLLGDAWVSPPLPK